jgi:hypothetical protein
MGLRPADARHLPTARVPDGKIPVWANRRACPPSEGTIQTSPPYVRLSKLPALRPTLTIRVRDARVDTKAIELPSGENAV